VVLDHLEARNMSKIAHVSGSYTPHCTLHITLTSTPTQPPIDCQILPIVAEAYSLHHCNCLWKDTQSGGYNSHTSALRVTNKNETHLGKKKRVKVQ